MADLPFGIINGPSQCVRTQDLCSTQGGASQRVRDEEFLYHSLPKTDQHKLTKFFEDHQKVDIPEVYIFGLPRARVYDGIAVLSSDCSQIARDISIAFSTPFESHPLLGQYLVEALPLAGSTIAVSCNGSNSYYHWLLDELPRMLLAGYPDADRLLVSPPSQKRINALQALKPHLNFNCTRIFWPDYHLRNIYCESLFCSTYISPTGMPGTYTIELLKDLASRLTSGITKSNLPEKILIERKPPTSRSISYEPTTLQNIISDGYIPVDLDQLEWIDQILLFQNAKEIISPHGAGLANLVFCNNKPLVVEIFNSGYVHWCYWHLANLVGAEYFPLAFPIHSDVNHDPREGANSINIDSDFDLLRFTSTTRPLLSNK